MKTTIGSHRPCLGKSCQNPWNIPSRVVKSTITMARIFDQSVGIRSKSYDVKMVTAYDVK